MYTAENNCAGRLSEKRGRDGTETDECTTQEGTGDGGRRGRGDDDDGGSEHHERRMKNAMKTRRMNDEDSGCSI